MSEITTNEIGATEADGLPGAGAAGHSPLIDATAAAAMNPPPIHYPSQFAHNALSPAERARRYDALHAGRRAGLSIAEIARGLRVGPQEFRRWLEREGEATERAAKAATFKKRECNRCKTPILSEHAGHRHCVDCRAWLSEAADSPYTPDSGGSRGKQVRAVRS